MTSTINIRCRMNRPNRRIHCGTARYRESSDQMNAGLHCGTSRPVDILRVPTVGLLIECSRASAISAVNNPSGDVARCDRRQGGVLYGDGSVFGDTLISPTNDRDHPVAASDSPFKKRAVGDSACIALFCQFVVDQAVPSAVSRLLTKRGAQNVTQISSSSNCFVDAGTSPIRK